MQKNLSIELQFDIIHIPCHDYLRNRLDENLEILIYNTQSELREQEQILLLV